MKVNTTEAITLSFAKTWSLTQPGVLKSRFEDDTLYRPAPKETVNLRFHYYGFKSFEKTNFG